MSATELTPSQRYAEGVARGDWQNDPAQHAALAELDRIHLGLLDSAEDGWLDRLSWFWKKPEPVKGLYFWGGVGRGKTFLVDLFYDGLPIKQKYRTHFHRFMRSVHERLREHQGQSDPLAKIAQEWRSNLRVLVLDEGRHSGGVGEGVVTALVEAGFGHLPLRRVCGADTYTPLAGAAMFGLPSDNAVIGAALDLAQEP